MNGMPVILGMALLCLIFVWWGATGRLDSLLTDTRFALFLFLISLGYLVSFLVLTFRR